MESVPYIPQSSSSTLYNISTANGALSGMPTSPYYSQVIHIKDFGGHASAANITLVQTNNSKIIVKTTMSLV